MKTFYIISEHTKEHIRWTPDMPMSAPGYKTVEADDEGWIAHTGTENPLPGDVRCAVKNKYGIIWTMNEQEPNGHESFASTFYWESVSAYRPILEAEPVQEPEQTKPKRLFDDLLERLDASHSAAQALPGLVEQLRDRLKPLGLGVMYLSEFDAVEPKPYYGTSMTAADVGIVGFSAPVAEPDMSDWRNWRAGDLLECVEPTPHLTLWAKYAIAGSDTDHNFVCVVDDRGKKYRYYINRFRFHSRPAKGE